MGLVAVKPQEEKHQCRNQKSGIETEKGENVTANELKLARKRLGLTQTKMAEALCTPVDTYQGWEQGRYGIPGTVSLAVKWVELAKQHR